MGAWEEWERVEGNATGLQNRVVYYIHIGWCTPTSTLVYTPTTHICCMTAHSISQNLKVLKKGHLRWEEDMSWGLTGQV